MMMMIILKKQSTSLSKSLEIEFSDSSSLDVITATLILVVNKTFWYFRDLLFIVKIQN